MHGSPYKVRSMAVVPCGGHAQQELTPVNRRGLPVVELVLSHGNVDNGSDRWHGKVWY